MTDARRCQRLGRRGRQPFRDMRAELGAVEPQFELNSQAHRVAFQVQHSVAERFAEPVKQATQPRARLALIAFGPEQRGKVVAGVWLSGNGQVHDQRQPLTQPEVDRPCVALQARWAKGIQPELSHTQPPV
jgi:hypothetical protein